MTIIVVISIIVNERMVEVRVIHPLSEEVLVKFVYKDEKTSNLL